MSQTMMNTYGINLTKSGTTLQAINLNKIPQTTVAKATHSHRFLSGLNKATTLSSTQQNS